MLQRRAEPCRVVFDVRWVPEKHPRDSGVGEVLLGGEVVRANLKRRGVGAKDGGVGNKLHAGCLGGIDDGPMFGDLDGCPCRRDEQKAGRSCERLGEGCGFAVIGFADLYAERREVGRFGWGASSRDDLIGRWLL
jgi:hypothetical protein